MVSSLVLRLQSSAPVFWKSSNFGSFWSFFSVWRWLGLFIEDQHGFIFSIMQEAGAGDGGQIFVRPSVTAPIDRLSPVFDSFVINKIMCTQVNYDVQHRFSLERKKFQSIYLYSYLSRFFLLLNKSSCHGCHRRTDSQTKRILTKSICVE